VLNSISRESISQFKIRVPEIDMPEGFLSSILNSSRGKKDFKNLYRLGRRRDKHRDKVLVLKEGEASRQRGYTPGSKLSSLDCLSEVVLLNVLSYLHFDGIMAVGNCNRALALDCRGNYIWRSLWIQNFGAMWNSDVIVAIRLARSITWNPCPELMPIWSEPAYTSDSYSYHNQDNNYERTGAAAKAKNEMLGLGGSGSPRRSPRADEWEPVQGWYMFFLEFEACWQDWLLAGHCSKDRCLVGLGGNIYNITTFMPHHPGSIETLTEVCGGDATEHFVDIGHSSHAVNLAKEFIMYSPFVDSVNGMVKKPVAVDSIEREGGERRGEEQHDDDMGSTGSLSLLGSDSGVCGERTKGRSEGQNQLHSQRQKLPINSHRRQHLTHFQQVIKREQRAMERNAYKWNLQRSNSNQDLTRINEEEGGGGAGDVDDDDTTPAQAPSRVASYSSSGRTVSEDMGFLNLMRSVPAAAPAGPLEDEITGATTCCRGAHFGRSRALYNPVLQEYLVWWTCCRTYEMSR
jgi:hypothetical protein